MNRRPVNFTNLIKYCEIFILVCFVILMILISRYRLVFWIEDVKNIYKIYNGTVFVAGDDVSKHVLYVFQVIFNPFKRFFSVQPHNLYPSLFHYILAPVFLLLGFDEYSLVFLLLGSLIILFSIVFPVLEFFILTKKLNLRRREPFFYFYIIAITFFALNFQRRVFNSLNDGNYPELTTFVILYFTFLISYYIDSIEYFKLLLLLLPFTVSVNLLGGSYFIMYVFVLFILNTIFFSFKKVLSSIFERKFILVMLSVVAFHLPFIITFIYQLTIILTKKSSVAVVQEKIIPISYFSLQMFLNESLFTLLIVLSIFILTYWALFLRKANENLFLAVLSRLLFYILLSFFGMLGYVPFRISRIMSYLFPTYVTVLLTIITLYFTNHQLKRLINRVEINLCCKKLHPVLSYTSNFLTLVIRTFTLTIILQLIVLSNLYVTPVLFKYINRSDSNKLYFYGEFCNNLFTQSFKEVRIMSFYPLDLYLPHVCFLQASKKTIIRTIDFNDTVFIFSTESRSFKFIYAWWITSAELYHSPDDPALIFHRRISEVFSSGNKTALCLIANYTIISEPYSNQWYPPNSTDVLLYISKYNYSKFNLADRYGERTIIYVINNCTNETYKLATKLSSQE